MKFKVGEKVECIYDGNGTFQDIKKGQIYTVGNIQNDGWIMVKGGTQYYKPKRFQKVQFTKSDLKDGDKCSFRRGGRAEYNRDYYDNEDYNEDLTHKNNRELDIVKVERPIQYETIFERKEEILDEVEKEYLKNVIKPFKNRITNIKKMKIPHGREVLYIEIEDDFLKSTLPSFKENSMYRGMKKNKLYTLEELGL